MSKAFKLAVIMLAMSLLALGQARSDKFAHSEIAPFAEILRPALQKIKSQSSVPILLPSKLPSSIKVSEIHSVDGEAKTDGWGISLYYKDGCGDACFAGSFGATRGEKASKDQADKVVRLANGIRGYYTARSCGGSCAPPQISWEYKGVLYSIQFNVHNKTKRQDELEIVALANSAIAGGVR